MKERVERRLRAGLGYVALLGATLVATPAAATGESGGESAPGSGEAMGDVSRPEPDPAPEDGYGSNWFLLPLVGYTPETGVGFAAVGVMDFRGRSQPPDVEASIGTVSLAATTRGQLLLNLSVTRVPGDGMWRATTTLEAKRWQTDFFGIGNATREDDHEVFLDSALTLDMEVERRIATSLRLGCIARARFDSLSQVDSSGLIASTEPAGHDGGWLMGVGPSLTLDRRDVQALPHRGVFARAGAVALPGLPDAGMGTSGFADLRAYLPLVRSTELATQVRLDASAGPVPFYDLPALGGMNLLRGLFEGRFSARSLVAAQSELRFPIWRWISGVGFGGAGEVADRIDSMRASGLHWAAGGGLRVDLNADEGIRLRLDVGVGDDLLVPQFYLSILEAF